MPSGACGYHILDVLVYKGDGNMRLAVTSVHTLLSSLSVILLTVV